MFDAQGDANEAITNSDLLLGTRQKFTPYGYQVLLIGNKLQALKISEVVNPTNGNTEPQQFPASNEFWDAIVGMYGQLREGISQIRLDLPWEESQVIGTVSFDPTDNRFLLFDVDTDTVPQNTMPPVNAVINPLVSGPGAGLPAAAEGQRYLLLESIGSDLNPEPATAWGPVVANANDIVQYFNDVWNVVFDSESVTSNQFVTNIVTGLQYRWTGSEWVKSYEGLYPGGEWSLVL